MNHISPRCRIYASMSFVSIGSGNDLSRVRHQAIIWSHAGLFLIGVLRTLSLNLIKIQYFRSWKCIWKYRLRIFSEGDELSHLFLEPQICVKKSGQHWFRQWLVAYLAPSHYLNKCWFIVNWTPEKKFQWNLNRNFIIFFQGNYFGGHFFQGGDELKEMK